MGESALAADHAQFRENAGGDGRGVRIHADGLVEVRVVVAIKQKPRRTRNEI